MKFIAFHYHSKELKARGKPLCKFTELKSLVSFNIRDWDKIGFMVIDIQSKDTRSNRVVSISYADRGTKILRYRMRAINLVRKLIPPLYEILNYFHAIRDSFCRTLPPIMLLETVP